MSQRRYLGTWRLPSLNSCNAYLSDDGQLVLEWDRPPSPSWPRNDVAYYRSVTFPAIVHAVAVATGQRAVGIQV